MYYGRHRLVTKQLWYSLLMIDVEARAAYRRVERVILVINRRNRIKRCYGRVITPQVE